MKKGFWILGISLIILILIGGFYLFNNQENGENVPKVKSKIEKDISLLVNEALIETNSKSVIKEIQISDKNGTLRGSIKFDCEENVEFRAGWQIRFKIYNSPMLFNDRLAREQP